MEREALDIDTETLQKRIVICYTGEPRNSGTNNWEITKRHSDGDNECLIFSKVSATIRSIYESTFRKQWEKVGEILKNSHPYRKRLSPNITTQQLDLLIEKALNNGAIAPKIAARAAAAVLHFSAKKADALMSKRHWRKKKERKF